LRLSSGFDLDPSGYLGSEARMSLACDLLRDTSMTVCKKGLISEELQCSPDDLLVFMHFLPKFDETLGIDPMEEIRGNIKIVQLTFCKTLNKIVHQEGGG